MHSKNNLKKKRKQALLKLKYFINVGLKNYTDQG